MCTALALYVISIPKRKVLRRISAVRCYRGEAKKVKFYPSESVILVKHYVSNRGVNYITILWKPEPVDIDSAISIAKSALGLLEEEEIRIQ